MNKHSTELGVGRGTGAGMIAAERVRQIVEEGWTAEHDDGHLDGSLATVAGIYALPCHLRDLQSHVEVSENGGRDLRYSIPRYWPWAHDWYKPDWSCGTDTESRICELVKAGALIAAEIDRLRRARHP